MCVFKCVINMIMMINPYSQGSTPWVGQPCSTGWTGCLLIFCAKWFTIPTTRKSLLTIVSYNQLQEKSLNLPHFVPPLIFFCFLATYWASFTVLSSYHFSTGQAFTGLSHLLIKVALQLKHSKVVSNLRKVAPSLRI